MILFGVFFSPPLGYFIFAVLFLFHLVNYKRYEHTTDRIKRNGEDKKDAHMQHRETLSQNINTRCVFFFASLDAIG